jgi:hypothetical protein
VHFANLLEPWILLRLTAGLVAALLFARAGWTSYRVLRHFDVSRATEGQLALERQTELAWALVRVATILQVALLALSMLAGDRLASSIRGAMCGYGVFHATPWGFRSLALTAGTAVTAGVVSELYALDGRVKSFDLVRPLAIATLVLVPLSLLDLLGAAAFAFDLDLSVVASCCSVRLDAVAAGAAGPVGLGATARGIAATGGVLTIALSIMLALVAARRPRSRLVLTAGAFSLITLPFALAAAVLEVAPHAFELPQHVCPFCLLRPNVLGLGYPLFGAILLAIIWSVGAAVGSLLARTESAKAASEDFARTRLRWEALAWGLALALGVIPIVRFAWLSGGASLFR